MSVGTSLSVTFHGVRGSTPCHGDDIRRYGGNTSCVSIAAPGEDPLVFDLGTGLRYFGQTQPHDGSFRGSCLLTHLHWDHTQGLPFFVPILRAGATLDIYGPCQEDDGSVERAMRRFMAETLAGFLARDYMRVAKVHFDYGFVPKTHNVETFAQALRAVGEPIFGLTARDVSMARLLEQLFETTRRFDMQLQPQLVMLQKTMVVVEGVARTLDPAFDIWHASRPVIETWMVENLGPEARLRDAADGLTSLGKLAQNLPQVLRDTEVIASQLADGGLRLHPDSVRAIAMAQLRRTRHVRVALWIAAGALGILAIGLM